MHFRSGGLARRRWTLLNRLACRAHCNFPPLAVPLDDGLVRHGPAFRDGFDLADGAASLELRLDRSRYVVEVSLFFGSWVSELLRREAPVRLPATLRRSSPGTPADHPGVTDDQPLRPRAAGSVRERRRPRYDCFVSAMESSGRRAPRSKSSDMTFQSTNYRERESDAASVASRGTPWAGAYS